MKYTELAGVSFEEYVTSNHPVAPIIGCNYNEIFERYRIPSLTKATIWYKWCRWCDEMNKLGYSCGIQIEKSSNFFFTITGHVSKDGEVFDLWITSKHNRMYRHQSI